MILGYYNYFTKKQNKPKILPLYIYAHFIKALIICYHSCHYWVACMSCKVSIFKRAFLHLIHEKCNYCIMSVMKCQNSYKVKGLANTKMKLTGDVSVPELKGY